jgi:hypothetical protein
MYTTSKWPYFGVFEGKKRPWEHKNIFEETMIKIFPKFNEKCKLSDPRISMNPKHKKHEENYTEVHHEKITQNQW